MGLAGTKRMHRSMGIEWLADHVDRPYTRTLPWAEAAEALEGKNIRPSLERIEMR